MIWRQNAPESAFLQVPILRTTTKSSWLLEQKRKIKNNQRRDPVEEQGKTADRLLFEQFNLPAWAKRCGPSNLYNCHGLTFASRRTGIHDTSEVDAILDHDSWESVDVDEVLPGDIVLYFDAQDGDLEHSAIVISVPEPLTKVPMVISKWGAFSEVVHPANKCPYNLNDRKFFRMREWLNDSPKQT